jgi:FixJ family two-component response regulator
LIQIKAANSPRKKRQDLRRIKEARRRSGHSIYMVSYPSPVAHPLVLIVDDDSALRSALKFALELEGFRVDACDSGEALLAYDLPDDDACLVIDERLPGVNGLEALRQLRARDVALPAVLITTNPQPTLRAAAAAAGVPIVEKPLLNDALLGSIRAALAA